MKYGTPSRGVDEDHRYRDPSPPKSYNRSTGVRPYEEPMRPSSGTTTKSYFNTGSVSKMREKYSDSVNSMRLLNLSTLAKSRIIGETQHPTSVARIQELEAPKPLPEDVPEAEKQVNP